MPESTHAVLSPSSSAIWLKCTPSAVFSLQFPDEETTFAQEGTEAHALAEFKLKDALGMEAKDPRGVMKYLTPEMETYTDDYTSFVLETLSDMKTTCKDPAIFIEQKLDLSTYVPGGFGYGDCILISDGTLHVIDLKYGQGVLVDAEWNSQFLLYALGAYDLLCSIYDIHTIKVTAFQPRRENVSTFTLTEEQLLTWAEDTLKPQAKLASGGEGTFVAGDHCRFCKARSVCRKRAEHNLELAKYDFAPPDTLDDIEISAILERIGEFSSWAESIQEYALSEALKGRHFDGWKVVEGKSARKFIDEDKVADKVKEAGFEPYERKLLGITAMTKLLGKKRFTELLDDFIAKAPGKPTLVPETDKRKPLDTAKTDFSSISKEE